MQPLTPDAQRGRTPCSKGHCQVTLSHPGRPPQRSVRLTHSVAAAYCDPGTLVGRVNQAGLGLTSQKEVNHHVLKGNRGSPDEVQDVEGPSSVTDLTRGQLSSLWFTPLVK